MSYLVDDYTPLWEVASVLRPLVARRSRQNVQEPAIRLLKKLWSRDLVAFFRGTTFSGEEEALRSDEVESELQAEGNWDWGLPRGAAYVQALATDLGRVEYLTSRPDLERSS